MKAPHARGKSGVPPRVDVAGARAIAADAASRQGEDGRAGKRLARELRAIERRYRFTPAARAVFQDALARLGVASRERIVLPADDQPFWFRGGHPLAGFRSRPELPSSADVVVIGAGLTGASTAYHLAEAVRDSGLRVVVVDQGDPAGEASGRNAGHFELIPENSVGVYEGLARERLLFLRRRYSTLPREVLQAESERQASLVLGLALRNRDRFREIIQREDIDCDFSPRGWLYLAHTDREERAICDEVTLAAQQGERIEIWSRGKIREEFGIKTNYVGRFIPGDGSYHPFKYVCGLLAGALRFGVELYTGVRVRRVASDGPDRHKVETDGGTIVARRVVVATNAFTSRIFPELAAIRPRQSQIIVTEHAPDRTRGRIVTTELGPVFFSQPREGARHGRAPLLMGGGADRPMKNPSSRRRSLRIHDQLMTMRDHLYPELRGRPPSTEWIGPMGFTPDQLPAIGFLRPGVIVAVPCNGYGGSYTTAAGRAAASMALDGEVPDWVPEDAFSPRRLLSSEPLFMSEQDSLWRVAASLCRQLKSVNGRIAEALRIDPNRRAPRAGGRVPSRRGARKSSRVGDVDPAALRVFPAFRGFTAAEIRELLAMMRRWDVTAGTTLFYEGSPAGTCFFVVRGTVEVTMRVRGQDELLAALPAGSIFGQVSLIDGEPRTATCSVRDDAILFEMEREPCERLFRGRSSLALKFLAAMGLGLVSALRGADRQLMRLEVDARATGRL